MLVTKKKYDALLQDLDSWRSKACDLEEQNTKWRDAQRKTLIERDHAREDLASTRELLDKRLREAKVQAIQIRDLLKTSSKQAEQICRLEKDQDTSAIEISRLNDILADRNKARETLESKLNRASRVAVAYKNNYDNKNAEYNRLYKKHVEATDNNGHLIAGSNRLRSKVEELENTCKALSEVREGQAARLAASNAKRDELHADLTSAREATQKVKDDYQRLVTRYEGVRAKLFDTEGLVTQFMQENERIATAMNTAYSAYQITGDILAQRKKHGSQS
jgi:chromosome segregation ATPase